tara:strand:- start:244 stop:432 length:189 start_codon:yes stop_codon:yes gene_type:complete
MNMKFSFEERINEQNNLYLVSLWGAELLTRESEMLYKLVGWMLHPPRKGRELNYIDYGFVAS